MIQQKGNAEQETGGRGCSEHITAEECEDVTGSHLLQIQDHERNERLLAFLSSSGPDVNT